jgi:hypothetical protein
MSELKGTPGELQFTVEIIRKATGEKEVHHLVGRILPDDTEEKEEENGSNS